ncbi:MAG: hypothetical protein WCC10_14910, partial [Tumebacillaceae bacterium]
PVLISFTDDDGQHVRFFRYESEGGATVELDRQSSAGYPTAVSTHDGRTLFYTSGNAVHQLDEQGGRRKIASGFENVDFLRLDEKRAKLYMRVIQPEHRNRQLVVCDLKTGGLQVLDEREIDRSVRWFDLEPSSGRLLALTYSEAEEMDKIKAARRDGTPPDPAVHQLVLRDVAAGTSREVTTIAQHAIDVSISPDGKHALYTAFDRYEAGARHTIYHVDLETGHHHPVFTDQDGHVQLVQPQYAAQGTGLYVMGTRADGRTRAVCFYDFKTKKLIELWARPNGMIHNFVVLK